MAGGLEHPTGENMQTEEETGEAEAKAAQERGAELAGGDVDATDPTFRSAVVSPDVIAIGNYQLRRIQTYEGVFLLMGGVGPGPWPQVTMTPASVDELIDWLEQVRDRL